MQASRSQLLPSSNGTCVSGQLLSSPVVESEEMHRSKSLLYRSDGGVWGKWREGTQLYPEAKPRGEGHHMVMVTSELAKELRIKRLKGTVWGQQLSVGCLLQVKMPRLEQTLPESECLLKDVPFKQNPC